MCWLFNSTFAGKLLGVDDAPLLEKVVDDKEGHDDDAKGSWWFRENQRPLDSAEMFRYFRYENDTYSNFAGQRKS